MTILITNLLSDYHYIIYMPLLYTHSYEDHSLFLIPLHVNSHMHIVPTRKHKLSKFKEQEILYPKP